MITIMIKNDDNNNNDNYKDNNNCDWSTMATYTAMLCIPYW